MRNLDCRWITCDQHFKYTICLLKKVLADKLYDAFEAKGYKTPWCVSFVNDACNCCEGCMFENVRDEDGVKHYDADKDEAEAMEFADKLIASFGSSGIEAMYKKLLEASIEMNMQELAKLNNEIKEKQKELAGITSDTNEHCIAESTKSLLDAWKLI